MATTISNIVTGRGGPSEQEKEQQERRDTLARNNSNDGQAATPTASSNIVTEEEEEGPSEQNDQQKRRETLTRNNSNRSRRRSSGFFYRRASKGSSIGASSASSNTANNNNDNNSHHGHGRTQQFQNFWSRTARRSWSLTTVSSDHDTTSAEGEDVLSTTSVKTSSKLPPSSPSPGSSCSQQCCSSMKLQWNLFIRTCKKALSNPYILFVMILVFVIICSIGLSIILVANADNKESIRNDELDKAMEMAYQIESELHKATLPLFTMTAMAEQVVSFNNLPTEIVNTSTYYKKTINDGGTTTRRRSFRNVTGICDNQDYIDEYAKLAQSVKVEADMPKVLINIQLSPIGVVCLVHPLVNTEDFTDGTVMDNRFVLGLDLLNDPPSTYYANLVIQTNQTLLQGPVKLAQQGLENILIIRSPIYVDNEQQQSNDGSSVATSTSSNVFWGFATILLNWEVIESQLLEIHDFFEMRGMEFQLTRTEVTVLNSNSGDNNNNETKNERTVVIAESSNESASLTSENSKSVPIQILNSGWVLTIGYVDYDTPHWVIWGSILVVLFALISSLAVMVILVNKMEHEKLLYRMMPKSVINKIQRGQQDESAIIERYDEATICFIDIVSFTTISGQMTATEVMDMLKILYTEYDKLADMHQVFNVETIGDAYIVIGGGPEQEQIHGNTINAGVDGAQRVASFALDVMNVTRNLSFGHSNQYQVSVRCGLASGLVIAGVVGTTLVPKYTLFGDTVTLADTLESASKAKKILCSSTTYRLLCQSKTHQFDLELRKRYDDNDVDHQPSSGDSKSRRKETKKLYCKGREIKEAFWINGVINTSKTACSSNNNNNMKSNDTKSDDIIDSVELVVGNGAAAGAGRRGSNCSAMTDDDFTSTPQEDYVNAVKDIDIEVGESSRRRSSISSYDGDDVDEEMVIVKNSATSKTADATEAATLASTTLGTQQPAASTGDGDDNNGTLSRISSSSSVSDLLNLALQTTTDAGVDADDKENGINCSNVEADTPVETEGAAVVDGASKHNEEEEEDINESITPKVDIDQDDRQSKALQQVNLSSSCNSAAERRSSALASIITDMDNDSIQSKDSAAFEDYWSGLANAHDAWQSDDQGQVKGKRVGKTCWKSLRRICYISVTYKRILLVTVLTFCVLCCTGLTTVLMFAKDYEEDQQSIALQKAEDTDRWLENEIRKSLLPLFAMSELVKDLEFIFDELPYVIENTTLYQKNDINLFRNTTGVCDSEDILRPFNEMAASIKENAELQQILVNVQLAPHGVLCLTHPKNNTEDFTDGAFLDTSGAIGLDLLQDPTRSTVSKAGVKQDRWTLQGPIKLVQGNSSVVDEAVIGRFPIRSDHHFVTIDDETYKFWGFSIVLMDWDKLKQKFGLYDFFSKDGMEFKMTRTDVVVNSTTNEKTLVVKTIAESERSWVLHEDNSVSLTMETGDNGWVLTVGYESGFSPRWKVWGSILVGVASFLISILLLLVLVTTKEHKLLLYRMMPKKVIKDLQRGETIVERDGMATIFFSRILGFSTLSGQMKPNEFMIMLNQVYEAFDKLTAKHNVSKVETIGATYIVMASGINKQDREGSVRVALFALDAMKFVRNYRYKDMRLFVRSGLASGPVVSGVIGAALPKYTIFGDTVNFASRMESTSKSMKIQCSNKTKELLRDNSSGLKFTMEERLEGGKRGIMVKGKGIKYTWWVCETGNNDENENDAAAQNTEIISNNEAPANKEIAKASEGRERRVSFSGLMNVPVHDDHNEHSSSDNKSNN